MALTYYFLMLSVSFFSKVDLQGEEHFTDSNEKYKLFVFQNKLSQLAKNPLDIVFVLDESGSVGASNYEIEKKFVDLIARTLLISGDNARTALVTFGSSARLHFNYIQRSDGDACKFFQKLKNVNYNSGGTNTGAGIAMAADNLKNGRSTTRKIIVLLSDGYTNDGDNPIVMSQGLKTKGITFFCVGIAGANEAELLSIASSPSHVYIISDFNYVVKVNEHLRQDIKKTLFVPQSTYLCGGRCDVHADCFCGSDGEYQCECKKGYVGIGEVGFCSKCPYGTYNSEIGQSQCKLCPPNSNTSREAATSANECTCENGFTGGLCKFSGCPKLHAPIGGHLEPTECGTSLHDKCSFWCGKGYCPYDGSVPNCLRDRSKVTQKAKICRITGKWSGPPMLCEEGRCKPPIDPPNGHFVCDPDTHIITTICKLECDEGYRVSGKEDVKLVCENNGLWKGKKNAKCIARTCKPLKNVKILGIKPSECGIERQPFNTHCQYYCDEGYKYVRTRAPTHKVGEGTRVCGLDGWQGRDEGFTCKDNEKPTISCPDPIKVEGVKKQKVSEKVNWTLPKASDNDDIPPKVTLIYPPFEKDKKPIKPPYQFPAGKNKLVYEAKDRSGNTVTCTLIIDVRDLDPPVVISCPKPRDEYTTSKNPISVDFDEPEFDDNSGKVKVKKSRKPGEKFETNEIHAITYIASDDYNNEAICEFFIRLNPYQCPYKRPPHHGTLNCTPLGRRGGQECVVVCDAGYGFAKKVSPVYKCLISGGIAEWENEKRWPDCGSETAVTITRPQITVQAAEIDCDDEDAIRRLQNEMLSELCAKDSNCNVLNIKVDCTSTTSGKRKKRNSGGSVLKIEFDIKMNMTDKTSPNAQSEASIQAELNRQLTSAINNFSKNNDESEIVVSVSRDISVSCSKGQIFQDGICVNCPAGTYYNGGSCLDCPLHTYQNVEASSKCKPCPKNTITTEPGSLNERSCKKSCAPGTYSSTGYEKCIACPKGTYQNAAQKVSCIKCPPGTSTWIAGADSIDMCIKRCKPGLFSATGFEPCDLCPLGSYQPKEGQANCIPCDGILYTRFEGMTDKSSCVEIDICDPNPCHYNGNCTRGDDYEANCTCIDGIAGPRCEININDCAPHLCHNKGVCIDEIDDYRCVCAAGFEGPQCEDNIDDCFDGACLNGGTCHDDINAFKCDCSKGFAGKRCQYALNRCDSNPCLNGGKCTNQIHGFVCCCKKGFSGTFCEIRENDCINSNPCLHNSTCVPSATNFRCICNEGYIGDRCEVNINECEQNPCANHGTCIDGVKDFSCECQPGFEGKRCETSLPSNYDVQFKVAKTTNYAIVETKEDLMSITVSFWMKNDMNSLSRGTPVSFSYKSPINDSIIANALTWYDVKKFIIYIQNQEIRTTIKGDGSWHNYALTWDSFDGAFKVYIDGRFIFSKNGISPGLPLFRGYFVLGQEQDLLAGGFSSTESFVGYISQFNVWNFAMTENEIKQVTAKCGYVGNVVAWPNVKQRFIGTQINIQQSDICNNKGKCGQKAECFCHHNNIYDVALCERAVESCNHVVCQHGQKCRTIDNTPVCDCNDGFSGRFCQFDINECFTNNGNCSHQCHNAVGSYRCSCPANFFLSEDQHNCLPTNRCSYKGSTYIDGEEWNKDCQKCECKLGKVTCKPELCAPVSCPRNSKAVQFIGECCKRCTDPKSKTCVVLPNNLYKTFDDKSGMKFTASCKYILAQDCTEGSFSVEIENGDKETKKKKIVINSGCQDVRISLKGDVFVSNEKVILPYNSSDTINIVKEMQYAGSGKKLSIIATLSNGVIVTWTELGRITVSAPDTMKSKMCGLCGNFNDYSHDDLMMRNYKQASTFTEFILSWRSDPSKSCAVPEYNIVGTPKIEQKGYCRWPKHRHNWDTARELCEIFRDISFNPCYPYVDPQTFMDLCLQDACMCTGSNCHCKAVKNYVNDCKKFNVQLNFVPSNINC